MLDAGVMSSVGDAESLKKYIYGIFGMDLEKLFNVFCGLNRNKNADIEGFRKSIMNFHEDAKTSSESEHLIETEKDTIVCDVNTSSIGILLRMLIEKCRRFGIRLDGNFLYMIVGYMSADGNSTFYTQTNIHMLSFLFLKKKMIPDMKAWVGDMLDQHVIDFSKKKRRQKDNFREYKPLVSTPEQIIDKLVKLYHQLN